MTTEDIRQQYGVHPRTIYNWRRGWYQKKDGSRHHLFPDHSHLDFMWNRELLLLEYNPIRVAVWVNKLKILAENKIQAKILKIRQTKKC